MNAIKVKLDENKKSEKFQEVLSGIKKSQVDSVTAVDIEL